MRTKVLLCAAALATSLATSMAQNVYSLNVVGYYNVTVPFNGLVLIANQLNTTNNEIQYVLPTVEDDTYLYKFTGGSFAGTQFEDFLGGWDQPTWTLNPGETAFIKDPGENPGSQTLTFVGTVLQGNLTNTLPVGLAYRSFMVPVQGTPQSFNIPAQDDDYIYVYNNGWSGDQYEDFLGGWGDNSGAGPTINVGQGFSYLKPSYNTSSAWVANFTVQ